MEAGGGSTMKLASYEFKLPLYSYQIPVTHLFKQPQPKPSLKERSCKYHNSFQEVSKTSSMARNFQKKFEGTSGQSSSETSHL